ncbi:ABC transporter substrate-binding protein [Campylobacter sp. RM16704]|uniref:ABC transporter substrate-binding protein n=1 Tax=Campylobacter sp. RM16704 TaxID=1500960 RepID=UPI000581DB80|nr:NrtA/SsuA/CpmA family ABC transporter substrate-binding protein [Campylobacter sp. RM16704]AJC86354.1 nitrate/sulfonate/bicarbonate ABC transporter, periplasmic substrate-binding protein [Campylobacter sp. RM16704]
MKTLSKNSLKIITMTIFSILFLIACNQNSSSKENIDKNFTAKKIAITYVKAPLNIPSIIEKEKAIFQKTFDKYNIPVFYSQLTTGPEQTQALASGDIQFLYAVGSTSVILAKANGLDIKIVNKYSKSSKTFTILSQKGTKFITADDIKGKKIAGPKGTILHELLLAYLDSLGLKEKDIEFISMGIPQAQAALVGKSVDMALLAGPNAYNLIQDGYNVVTTADGLIEPLIVVATSKEFYNNNKILVEEFINAQKEILQYIDNNYEESMNITAKETNLSIDDIKQMYPLYNFDININNDDIKSMEKTKQFMLNNKMIDHDVKIKELFIN